MWPGQGVARRARSRVRTERSRRGPNRSRHGADRTSRQRLHSHCFGERAGLDQGRTHRLARQPRPTAVVQLPCGHDCGQHVTDAAVLRAPASSPTPRGQLSAAGTPASAADRTPQPRTRQYYRTTGHCRFGAAVIRRNVDGTLEPRRPTATSNGGFCTERIHKKTKTPRRCPRTNRRANMMPRCSCIGSWATRKNPHAPYSCLLNDGMQT